jgi:hypothetical protein
MFTWIIENDKWRTDVFSPSLKDVSGQAQYYPASHVGQNNILNLIVPAKSTGYYALPTQEPGFSDLNFLPYHQYVGVDYRTKIGSSPPSVWSPITPDDLGFAGKLNKFPGEQNLWHQTQGLFIVDGIGGTPGTGDRVIIILILLLHHFLVWVILFIS